MDDFDRLEKADKNIEQRGSSKLLKEIVSLIKECNEIMKENQNIFRHNEKLLIEIKEELKKVRFNTQ